jgi:hypothetical protein
MMRHLLEGHTGVSPMGLGMWVNVASLLCLPLYLRAALLFPTEHSGSILLPQVVMVALPTSLYWRVRRPYPSFARGLRYGAIGLTVLALLLFVLSGILNSI